MVSPKRMASANGMSEPALRHLLGRAHRERRRAAQTLGQRLRLVHQTIVRHHLAHQTHLARGLGVDALAGEQQLHRRLPADEARHAHRALDGRHAEQHLGEAELGALARDHEVAGDHQREAEAERVAVDRGDDRLPDLDAVLERGEAGDLPERVIDGVAGAALPQVGAGAEGAARCR